MISINKTITYLYLTYFMLKLINREENMKDKILNIIIVILVSICIFCSYKIVLWYQDNQEIKNESNKVVSLTTITESNNGKKINKPKNKFDPYWDFINYSLINVDFKKLLKYNSDTVGWINMKESNINYPIVQTNNNKYYLTHSYNKSYNDAGWVFMDYRNNPSLKDKNTIIYAHSRVDRSMFGTLRNATKKSWFKNKGNHIIRISTPTENTLWLVFSSYNIKNEVYYLKTSFNSDNEYEIWLNKMQKRSFFNYQTSVDKNDNILTLSSCYNSSGSIKTVIHAKLIKSEKR